MLQILFFSNTNNAILLVTTLESELPPNHPACFPSTPGLEGRGLSTLSLRTIHRVAGGTLPAHREVGIFV